VAPKGFDPKPALTGLKPDLNECFAKARAARPELHGKVKLRIVVSEAGKVQNVTAAPGGTVDDPTLLACVTETVKAAQFPKPPGTATATIVAPMVFHR
jgi:TonB family protein